MKLSFSLSVNKQKFSILGVDLPTKKYIKKQLKSKHINLVVQKQKKTEPAYENERLRKHVVQLESALDENII